MARSLFDIWPFLANNIRPITLKISSSRFNFFDTKEALKHGQRQSGKISPSLVTLIEGSGKVTVNWDIAQSHKMKDLKMCISAIVCQLLCYDSASK